MKNHCRHLLVAVALCAGVAPLQVQAQGSMNGSMPPSRAKNAQMLIKTLSEEKTEINTLAAQQQVFLRMNDAESRRIASLWGRWIREHKAASPKLMQLTKQNGGDPSQAKILKPPVLGSKMQMLMATHKDHQMAVMTSQQRYGMTNDSRIKMAMKKRATLARKHIAQMRPFMPADNMSGGAMSGSMGNSTTGANGARMDGRPMPGSEGAMSSPGMPGTMDNKNKGAG